MRPGTCGAIGERAQVILVWVKALEHWNASHPMRLGVTRVKPRALDGPWHCNSRMPRNPSIGGVGKKLWGFKWGATYGQRPALKDSTAQGMMPESPKAWEGSNSVNTYSNGASEEFIGIYAKNRCQ